MKHFCEGIVGTLGPSKPIDDPSALFPLNHNAMSYYFMSGKNKGQKPDRCND